MRIYLTALALLCSALPIFAQRAADWSVEMAGTAQKIILQEFSGVPVVQTDKAYIGIDPETQKEVWSIKRSGNKLLAAATAEETDLCQMRNTPYVLVRGNVVDSRSGQTLLDKDRDGYKELGGYAVLPDLGGVLVQVVAKGVIRVIFIDFVEKKAKWSTEIAKNVNVEFIDISPEGKAAAAKAEAEAAQRMLEMPANATLLTPDGYLLYRYKKTLACINASTGKLLWAEKADAAELLLSPSGKALLVAEAEVGPAIEGAISRPKGRNVAAYDLSTGKPVWKKEIKANAQIRWVDAHPKFLTIVHRKGCNLYSYKTGEPLWEKDFSARRIVEITPNEDGYLVAFQSGYKIMQLDKKGKEMWKKAQILTTDDGEEMEDDTPDDSGIDRFEYAKGTVLVSADKIRFVPAKGSGMKRWRMKLEPRDRIAYDPERNNLVVLTLQKLLLVNPDQNPKTALEVKVNIKNPYAFHAMEVREKGYFMTSENEYVLIDPAAGTAMQRYYPKPLDATTLLLQFVDVSFNSLNLSATASPVYCKKYGVWRPGYCNREARQNRAIYHETKRDLAYFGLIPPARFNAFKQNLDFAYYLTGREIDGKDKNVLVKVSKDAGSEADKLLIDNARPIYYVDEVEKRVYYAHKNTLKVFQM
jgi:outer membrane protein assembly factor BamB